MKRNFAVALASIVALTGLAACASSGRSTAEGTVTGITELKMDAASGKSQVKTTIDSMTALEKADGGDLKPRYEAYLKEVSNLESLASRAKGHGQAMRDKGTAYFKTWEEQLGTMTDPEIKKRSEERRTELNKLYTEITKAMDGCRTSYEKLAVDLADIKKALDFDLSPNGVKNLASPMKTARADAESVTKALDAVDKKLDELAREMNTIQSPKS